MKAPFLLLALSWFLGASEPSFLPLEKRPPRWLDGAEAAGGRRYALLVGIGKHLRDPSWDLDWVPRDLEAIGEVLSEKCGFKVERLQDDQVSKAALETKIQHVQARMGGNEGLLLLYWVGHGFVSPDSECRYFLSHTGERPLAGGVEYSNTLGELDVAELLAPIRRAGKTAAVFVADACRVAALAPAPGRKPRVLTIADASIYSTQRGRFAVPRKDQKHSIFAESFAAALSDLSKAPSATVEQLYDTTRRRMEQDPGVKQRPELIVAGEGVATLRIFDREDLSLAVRVVDALTGSELRGAAVRLLDRELKSPAAFRRLVAGDYRLAVSISGYIRVVELLNLDEKHSGGSIEVSLYPQLELLEGEVKDSGGNGLVGVTCRLEGEYAGFLRDYHSYEAQTDDEGKYHFLVPPGAKIDAVTVASGPSRKLRSPFELSKLKPRQELRGSWLLKVYDLPPIVLPYEPEVKVVQRDGAAIPGCAFTGKNAQGRSEYRHEKTGIVLVLIPAGKFPMGSPASESGRYSDEGPAHEVGLSSFLIGKCEVTQFQWEQVRGTNPSYFRSPDRPVDMVSWEDCQEFCRKAGLSLPSEAEWEYACRAGSTGRFCFGDSDSSLDDYAWHSGNSGRSTHPVGQKKPNGFGLFDMHGNVSEWCEDTYHDSYEGSPSDGASWVSGGIADSRVLRGGSWLNDPSSCRSGVRYRLAPSQRHGRYGFRVVLRVASRRTP